MCIRDRREVEQVEHGVERSREGAVKQILGFRAVEALGETGKCTDVLLDDRRLAGRAEHGPMHELQELVIALDLGESELDYGARGVGQARGA